MPCIVAWLASACAPATSNEAQDVYARVRAHGAVHCAGVVRPGIAVPYAGGAGWHGLAFDMCRAIAAAVFGSPERMTFRPFFGNAPGKRDVPDDVVFLSGAQFARDAESGAAKLELGPAIVHDALALLVPAAGVAHAVDLGDKTICVEPGSASDRALTTYFAREKIALHEFPFQETDEMRQAYGDGKCDALAGPLSTLGSVRSDPQDGHVADRVLPELLADDPIFAATPLDEHWSRIVWWTFSVLVDAEDSGLGLRSSATGSAIPGVPPAIGKEFGLPARWTADVLAAGGNYGELFERDLGGASRLRLARGTNALWRDGGSIFGLYVQ